MIFRNNLSYLQQALQLDYEVSSTIKHRGEKGRQRENGLALFLRETLPGAYGVATGEIIPFKGKRISPQCDVVIYDRLRFPVLGQSRAVQQVPLESVFCVIECKSIIDKKALQETASKFRAIRQLPKCPQIRRLKKGKQRGPIFVLFGYRLKAPVAACKSFVQEGSKEQDFMVVALDKGSTVWITNEPSPVWVPLTDPDLSQYETLGFFFTILLHSMGSIDLGEPRFLDILLRYE